MQVLRRALSRPRRREPSAPGVRRHRELLRGELEPIARGGGRAATLESSLALAAEAAARCLGQEPRDNQLEAAWALATGRLAELPTGEGKTLAAALASVALVASGHSVQVLTVNDYLAARDERWMRPLYAALGITTGAIGAGDEGDTRQRMYGADVVYATAVQVGFDHLRDGLARTDGERRIRRFDAVIVDEADSILIDEARLPLVISGRGEGLGDLPLRAAAAAEQLRPGEHFTVESARGRVWLTDEGHARVEALLGGDLHDDPLLLRQVDHALRARALYRRDRDYVVVEGEVRLVDPYTGRTTPGRRWADGLHQAIEAKERLEPSAPRTTCAQMTIRSLIAGYAHVSGMTGTAVEVAQEVLALYGLETIILPPHRPSIRIDHPDRCFETEAEKVDAVLREIRSRHRAGQPVLVACSTVRECESFSAELRSLGILHEVLHARDHAHEAEVLAVAGAPGAVTVSTHLSGRGVDIHLGGPERQRASEAIGIGGLCVIGTERFESTRIERQLRGRAGRQGEPGASVFFCAPSDQAVAHWVPPGRRVAAEHRLAMGQRNVEVWNGLLRQDLLAFDGVFEHHRRAARSRRDELLLGAPHLLDAFDRRWTTHLQGLYALLDGIHLRAWGAEAPLAAFHLEAKRLLDRFLATDEDTSATEGAVDPVAPPAAMSVDDLGPRLDELDVSEPDTAPALARSIAGHNPEFGAGVLLDVIAVADLDGGTSTE